MPLNCARSARARSCAIFMLGTYQSMALLCHLSRLRSQAPQLQRAKRRAKRVGPLAMLMLPRSQHRHRRRWTTTQLPKVSMTRSGAWGKAAHRVRRRRRPSSWAWVLARRGDRRESSRCIPLPGLLASSSLSAGAHLCPVPQGRAPQKHLPA